MKNAFQNRSVNSLYSSTRWKVDEQKRSPNQIMLNLLFYNISFFCNVFSISWFFFKTTWQKLFPFSHTLTEAFYRSYRGKGKK